MNSRILYHHHTMQSMHPSCNETGVKNYYCEAQARVRQESVRYGNKKAPKGP